MPSFNFRAIGQAPENHGGGGFVPLGLFDTSELTGNLAIAQKAPAEPDSVVLSEEELNSRIKESFENGLVEGKNLAERGLFNVFKALRTASEGIHLLREKVLRESEDELLTLIIMVARKVILREVSQDRSILSKVLQNAIAGLSERDEITVRLNPDDYALATTGHADILSRELISDRMSLKPDPTVLSGCCLIDTDMGTINASIDAQLDEIYRRLLEERCLSPGTGA
ncbi:MAG: FliH/SctL family protein [Geobacteraceae bacterium]|nr:FliH/SctL family protein [Geobacteraceae bacterium]